MIEVEYDAQREEKEDHEAKMKEVHTIEELRKVKEAESKIKGNSFLQKFVSFFEIKKMQKHLIKIMIHSLNVCNYKLYEIWNYLFKIFISSMKIDQQNLIIHLLWELHLIILNSTYDFRAH